MSTAWVVPGLIAPALGGAMAQHLGWRSVFLLTAALPPVAAILAVPPLLALGRPTGRSGDAGPGAGTALRLAVGTGLVLGALSAIARSVAAAPVCSDLPSRCLRSAGSSPKAR